MSTAWWRELLDVPTVRAMMMLRAQLLVMGCSGVRPVIADLLAEMLNRGVHCCVPSHGSVGASGDLAPLAHLSLVLRTSHCRPGGNQPISTPKIRVPRAPRPNARLTNAQIAAARGIAAR
jgi:hypothetical protein